MLNEIFSKVHEKRTKKKKERPQSVFPALVHAARMKKHGHKYPAVTSWPHTDWDTPCRDKSLQVHIFSMDVRIWEVR